MTQPPSTILVLAGQRLGKVDPLAAAHGLQHKCLVPMLGRPIIGYVFDAADVAPLMARKEDVQAEHPRGQARFWKFSDGEFSNCNTFWARDSAALEVGEIFRGGGQFLKFPRRFLDAFGLSNLIGYRLGILSRTTMLERISRRFGKRIKVQVARRGRFAIDVDDRNTYEVTEKLLLADGLAPTGP